MNGDITFRKLPGETREEFIARIVAGWPPLDAEQKAQLRAIFRPVLDQPAAEPQRRAA